MTAADTKNNLIKIIVVLSTLLLLLFISSYYFLRDHGAKSYVSDTDDLQFSVNEASSTGVSITVENISETSYRYGAMFKLEKQENGNDWVSLNPISEWSQEDWCATISPKSSSLLSYTWDWYYGSIPPGNYRIIIDFSLGDESADQCTVYVEFSV